MAAYIAFGIGGLGASIGSYKLLQEQKLQNDVDKLAQEIS